jgi:hypothetical protein
VADPLEFWWVGCFLAEIAFVIPNGVRGERNLIFLPWQLANSGSLAALGMTTEL